MPNSIRRSVLLLCLLLAGLIMPFTHRVGTAATGSCVPRPLDLVLVLDDSGSMRIDEANDPDNLRITAAHLIVDLLDEQDRAGLVLFPLSPQRPAVELTADRQALHTGIEQFASTGGTDLSTALAKGLDLFPRSSDPARTRAILFLTDGAPDPATRRAQLGDMPRLAAEAQARGVRFYVVGLGPQYDAELVGTLTRESKSPLPWHVQSADGLGRAFLDILGDLKGYNVQAAVQGSVPVLGYSPKVTFVGLQRSNQAAPTVTWNEGNPLPAPAPISMKPEVAYQYTIKPFVPKDVQTTSARVAAPSAWKVEEPPVAVAVTSPTLYADLPAGESVAVQVQLKECVPVIPSNLTVTAQLLGPARNPIGAEQPLSPVPGQPLQYRSTLRLERAAGSHILQIRLTSADGLQVALAQQPVTLSPQPWWEIQVPPALQAGTRNLVTVAFRHNGEPATADQPVLYQSFPADPRREPFRLDLQPAGTGVWTGEITVPADYQGEMLLKLAGGQAELRTNISAVRLQPQGPAELAWSWWDLATNQSREVLLTAPAVGRLDQVPRYSSEGPVAFGAGAWGEAGGEYRLTGHLLLAPIENSRWPWLLSGLLRPRELEVRLVPQYDAAWQMPADSLVITVSIHPVPWWIWAAVVALILIIRMEAGRGTQLKATLLILTKVTERRVKLAQKRPGILMRFLYPPARRRVRLRGPGVSFWRGGTLEPALPPGTRLSIEKTADGHLLRSLSPDLPLKAGGRVYDEVILEDFPKGVQVGTVEIVLDGSKQEGRRRA